MKRWKRDAAILQKCDAMWRGKSDNDDCYENDITSEMNRPCLENYHNDCPCLKS